MIRSQRPKPSDAGPLLLRNIAKPSRRGADDGSLDGLEFRRNILPKLQDLPVRTIAEAMGTTNSHGSKVRCSHTRCRTNNIGRSQFVSASLQKIIVPHVWHSVRLT